MVTEAKADQFRKQKAVSRRQKAEGGEQKADLNVPRGYVLVRVIRCHDGALVPVYEGVPGAGCQVSGIPETVQSGYPEKTFYFTGEWEHMNLYSQRGSKVARRNRTPVWYPIYKADDGETIIPAWLMSEKSPTKE